MAEPGRRSKENVKRDKFIKIRCTSITKGLLKELVEYANSEGNTTIRSESDIILTAINKLYKEWLL